MRVVHLLAPGPMAGAERVVLGGTRALIDAGASVTLLILADTRCADAVAKFLVEADRLAVPHASVRTRGRVDPSAVVALGRTLRRIRPDLLHLHGYKALTYAALAAPRACASVATHHGVTAHSRSVRAYEALARRLYRRLTRVVAVSEAGVEELRAGGVPAARISRIPNFLALDLAPLDPSGPLLAGVAPELLYVGRLSPEKGLDVLLDAVRHVDGLRVRLLGEGRSRAALEAQVASMALGGRVQFQGFCDDVRPYLGAAQVLVLPSFREGLPMALIEAVAAGLPVVASRVGGIPQLVRDGDNGLLVPPGDAPALAAALTRMRDQLGAFRARAVAGAASVRDAYSPVRWAERTLALYRGILAGSGVR